MFCLVIQLHFFQVLCYIRILKGTVTEATKKESADLKKISDNILTKIKRGQC